MPGRARLAHTGLQFLWYWPLASPTSTCTRKLLSHMLDPMWSERAAVIPRTGQSKISLGYYTAHARSSSSALARLCSITRKCRSLGHNDSVTGHWPLQYRFVAKSARAFTIRTRWGLGRNDCRTGHWPLQSPLVPNKHPSVHNRMWRLHSKNKCGLVLRATGHELSCGLSRTRLLATSLCECMFRNKSILSSLHLRAFARQLFCVWLVAHIQWRTFTRL